MERKCSSSSSSTSSRPKKGKSKRSVVFLRPASREDDYEGPKRYSYHKTLAPWWTSWTDVNPGRKFYRCHDYYKGGSCDFFEWRDVKFGECENTVIIELLNVMDKLYEENKKLKGRNEEEKVYQELSEIEVEVKKLRDIERARDIEMKKWQLKYKVAIVILLLALLLLLFPM